MSMRNVLRRIRKAFVAGQTSASRPKFRRLEVEALEERVVPSTILWTNRGMTSGANNDRFDAVFGDRAEIARRVVDAAILSWQNVIQSFNYADASLKDTLRVSITLDGGVTARGHQAG